MAAPSAQVDACTAFLRTEMATAGAAGSAGPPPAPDAAAWTALVHVVLNSKSFLFID
jgi:hypothetical protein